MLCQSDGCPGTGLAAPTVSTQGGPAKGESHVSECCVPWVVGPRSLTPLPLPNTTTLPAVAASTLPGGGAVSAARCGWPGVVLVGSPPGPPQELLITSIHGW